MPMEIDDPQNIRYEPITDGKGLVKETTDKLTKQHVEATHLVVRDGAEITVTDYETYERAGRWLDAWMRAERGVLAWFAPLKQKAHEAHKAICDRETQTLFGGRREAARIKAERKLWKREEEDRQRAEELRLAEYAKVQEREELVAEAALMEDAGEPVAAAAILAAAENLPAPAIVLPSFVPPESNVSWVSEYKWRLQNEALVPRAYLTLDVKKITAFARAMKGTGKIPGIEFYADEHESRRTPSTLDAP